MSSYAEFEAPGGPVLIDQTDEKVGYDYESVARRSSLGTGARVSLTDAVEVALQSVSASFLGASRRLSVQPDEFTVEFGVRISGESGAIVSSEPDKAHFKVTMRWVRQANIADAP